MFQPPPPLPQLLVLAWCSSQTRKIVIVKCRIRLTTHSQNVPLRLYILNPFLFYFVLLIILYVNIIL
jgi:hypothetical protein